MYMESIHSKKQPFFAIKCDSSDAFAKGYCCHSKSLLEEAIMGENCHNHTQGTYYLYTNSESPYAKPRFDSLNCHLSVV